VLRRPVESAQYTSDDYGKLCRRFGITQSMGTVGDSYDCEMLVGSVGRV
jgi:transposase InsO family protein